MKQIILFTILSFVINFVKAQNNDIAILLNGTSVSIKEGIKERNFKDTTERDFNLCITFSNTQIKITQYQLARGPRAVTNQFVIENPDNINLKQVMNIARNGDRLIFFSEENISDQKSKTVSKKNIIRLEIPIRGF